MTTVTGQYWSKTNLAGAESENEIENKKHQFIYWDSDKVTNPPADKNTADENPTGKNSRLPNLDKTFPHSPFSFFFCGKKYGVVTLFTNIWFNVLFPTNSHRLKQFANDLNDRWLRATLNEQSLIATAQATPVGIALVLFAFLRSESSPES